MREKLKSLLVAVLVLSSCVDGLFAADILLVQGTSSTQQKDREYSKSLADYMERWLADTGQSFKRTDDDKLAKEIGRSTKLLILPYNPVLTEPEYNAVKAFVGRGGKLFVFYSADARLAELMGFKLGPYLSSTKEGRWSVIHFNQNAPANIPAQIRQESRNIRTVLPFASDARLIAVWKGRDADAGNTALVMSGQGVWMSHVLMAASDVSNKKLMLVALIAQYIPDAWRNAADKYMRDYYVIENDRSFKKTIDRLDKLAVKSGRTKELEAQKPDIVKAKGEVESLYAAGRYPEAVSQCIMARGLIVRAYVAAHKVIKADVVGVWDHSGIGLYDGDWDRTCAMLKKYGITDVFSNMAMPGKVRYNTTSVYKSDEYAVYGDQLNRAMSACRKNDIRFHLWMVCWNAGSSSKEFLAEMKAAGRLQRNAQGGVINWLCPSSTQNVQMLKDMVREVVKKYDIDGLQLDYIRYPNPSSCYCENCRKAFEQYSGNKMPDWPRCVTEGVWDKKKKFYEWRTTQITGFVRDVNAIVRQNRPSVKLSAAVYGKYPSCLLSVSQDWVRWLSGGLLDFVCPMNYTDDINMLRELIGFQYSLPNAANRIYSGIGVTAKESRHDVIQVIDQINLLAEHGSKGYVLFDLNQELEKEILPCLGAWHGKIDMSSSAK